MEINYASSEECLHDALLNRIIEVSAFFVVLAYISTLLRAGAIGWAARDIAHGVSVACILLLTAARKRIPVKYKALCLMILYTFGSAAGVYTLGLLAGTLFMFSTMIVIVAVLYSKRTYYIYVVGYLFFFTIVGYLFSTKRIRLPFDADFLITNPFHWTVYLLCIVFFATVTYETAYTYRKSRDQLIEDLNKKNQALQTALDEVKTLSGFLPICAYCGKVRDDKGYWKQLEIYISEHSDTRFSHGICMECTAKVEAELDEKKSI